MPQVEGPVKPGENTLIALGSNATSRHGTPREIVARAMAAIDTGPIRVMARSRLYRTPCFPAGAGPDYVNAAVLCDTALSPGEVLQRLHRVERDFDRVRKELEGDEAGGDPPEEGSDTGINGIIESQPSTGN